MVGRGTQLEQARSASLRRPPAGVAAETKSRFNLILELDELEASCEQHGVGPETECQARALAARLIEGRLRTITYAAKATLADLGIRQLTAQTVVENLNDHRLHVCPEGKDHASLLYAGSEISSLCGETFPVAELVPVAKDAWAAGGKERDRRCAGCEAQAHASGVTGLEAGPEIKLDTGRWTELATLKFTDRFLKRLGADASLTAGPPNALEPLLLDADDCLGQALAEMLVSEAVEDADRIVQRPRSPAEYRDLQEEVQKLALEPVLPSALLAEDDWRKLITEGVLFSGRPNNAGDNSGPSAQAPARRKALLGLQRQLLLARAREHGESVRGRRSQARAQRMRKEFTSRAMPLG